MTTDYHSNGQMKVILSGQVPYSQEAEEAVIGAVLIDPDAFLIVRSFLKPEDFYVLRNTYVWEALDRLSGRGDAIDYLTLQDELRTQLRLTEVGGPAYLTQLINSTPTSVHAEIYGRLVQRCAIRRRLLLAADEIKGLALDEEMPIEKVEAEAGQRLLRAQGVSLSGFVSMREAMARHFERTEEAFRNPRELLGVPSALNRLNDLTKGYRPGKLYVLAGRPGMGKSSFLFTEAAHMASMGLPVAFFTLEMPEEEVVDNLVAAQAGIEADKISSGKMDQKEWSRYVEAAGRLANWPLFIDDTAALSPSQLRLRCLRLWHEYGLSAVMVDYLQLMSGGREINYGNRDQEIGYISSSLKGLAKEIRVPVLAAAQLSREVEKREDKHPQLSDLRESGNIENDADLVMFFYRQDYYDKPVPMPVVSKTDIGIAKHRGGRTGPVTGGFYGAFKKFVNWENG